MSTACQLAIKVMFDRIRGINETTVILLGKSRFGVLLAVFYSTLPVAQANKLEPLGMAPAVSLQFVQETKRPVPPDYLAIKKQNDERVEKERLDRLKNDCEALGGHLEGETCIEPPPPPKVVYTAPTWSVGPIGNNYSYGYCTYYVASRRAVPQRMGDATNWEAGLRAAGWTISYTPVAGAIGISHVGVSGHVVIVEQVVGNQVLISEMNGTGGWNVVSQRLTNSSEFVYAY